MGHLSWLSNHDGQHSKEDKMSEIQQVRCLVCQIHRMTFHVEYSVD